MSEEDAFVAGIAAHPLDDLRRLVYADWLDERGPTEQAEYLRLVAALAAPGEAIDLTHPHAVRLLALADGIDHTWRTATGGRFDLWIDGYDPKKKIHFIRQLRTALGTGLVEGKRYSESLPLHFDDAATLELLVAKVNTLGDTATSRIMPSSLHTVTPGPRKWVVLRYDVLVNEVHYPESLRNAVEHMRRTLSAHPELAHHLSTIPELLTGIDGDSRRFTFRISGTFSLGRAGREEKKWRQTLFGGKSQVGARAVPPFVGLASVWTSDENVQS